MIALPVGDIEPPHVRMVAEGVRRVFIKGGASSGRNAPVALGRNRIVVVAAVTVAIQILGPQGQPVGRFGFQRALEDILLGVALAEIAVDILPLVTQPEGGPPEGQIVSGLQAIVCLVVGVSKVDPLVEFGGLAGSSAGGADRVAGDIPPIALGGLVV